MIIILNNTVIIVVLALVFYSECSPVLKKMKAATHNPTQTTRTSLRLIPDLIPKENLPEHKRLLVKDNSKPCVNIVLWKFAMVIICLPTAR